MTYQLQPKASTRAAGTGRRRGDGVPAAGPTPRVSAEARLLAVMRSNARQGALPFIVASIGFALLVAPPGAPAVYVTWAVALAAVTTARAVMVLTCWPPGAPARKAVAGNTVLLAVLGVLYGMTPLWLQSTTDFWFVVAVNLWLVGLAFAVLLSQGVVWRAGLAFALPVVVPLFGFLLVSDKPGHVMIGIGDLALSAYLFSIVRRSRALVDEETRQRLRSQQLARHHALQRRRSDRLVGDLTDEIERRKVAEAALKQARDAAEHMSNQDHLTSLANRRVFDRELARAWSASVASEKSVSVIACDIDLFRSYNEHYGTYAGDRCLVLIGETIGRLIADTPGFACRDSGDQFSVLLPETSEREALELAESIRMAVHELTIMHPGAIVERVVTASFGVATFLPAADVNAKTLVESADHALRRAKRCGGNCVFAIYGDVASDER